MILLDRYIIRTLLSAVAMVLLVLLMLGLMFLFVGEQGDIGVGQYGALQALEYSAMNLPQFALDAFPAATLIGSLLGVGLLARSNELMIMRASGMSRWRLGLAVLAGAAVLIGTALVVGEVLAQPLSQMADQRKAFAKYSNLSFAGGGAWIRDGQSILSVQGRQANLDFGGMMIVELTADNRVASVATATHATAVGPRTWKLHDFAETHLGGDAVTSSRSSERLLQTVAGAGLMQLAVTDPQELSFRSLRSAIAYLKANGLDATRYVFAFWARVARNAGILAATLFAVPFGFGSMRSASMGARTTLGFAVGILFFFMQRLAESGTEVFHLNPLLLAWVPTSLLAVVAVLLIWRSR